VAVDEHAGHRQAGREHTEGGIMRVRQISGRALQRSRATYVAVLSKDEEAVGALTRLAAEHAINAGQLTAIGAFSRATLGWFDRDKKDYRRIPVDEQVEVLSLVGDVALQEGKPKIHAHAVLGRADGSTVGGHLLSGEVWPTLEVVISEAPAELRKRTDGETGLALIDLDAG
jgi:predicted DNA-binding protein with PD1-like motif